MKYRTLGKTGVQVSVIGLGTHQFSGEWAKTFSEEEVRRMLERARDLGINFVDTAECYGDHTVESLVGKGMKSRRAEWIIGTKFGHAYLGSPQKTDAWSAAQVRQQLEDSLKALQTDYIDVYQFHSGSNKDFLNDDLWAMLNAQVQAGKVRFLGLSLAGELILKNDLRQLHAAGQVGVKVVQVVYNRLHAGAEKEILPYCETHQLGVLARVPLAKGFLGGHYRPGAVFAPNDIRSTYSAEFNDEQLRQVEEIRRQELPPGQNLAQWALAWCLKPPMVSSVIVGCKSIAQLELNAGAAGWVVD